MPKGILEFFLPEDQVQFEYAQNGDAYHYILSEFSQKLYRINKHDEIIPDEHLDKIKELFKECLGDVEL